MIEYTFKAIEPEADEPRYGRTVLSQILALEGSPLRPLGVAEARFVELCGTFGLCPEQSVPQGMLLPTYTSPYIGESTRWFMMFGDEEGPEAAMFICIHRAKPISYFWHHNEGMRRCTRDNRSEVLRRLTALRDKHPTGELFSREYSKAELYDLVF
jgi:hypothetical protein